VANRPSGSLAETLAGVIVDSIAALHRNADCDPSPHLPSYFYVTAAK